MRFNFNSVISASARHPAQLSQICSSKSVSLQHKTAISVQIGQKSANSEMLGSSAMSVDAASFLMTIFFDNFDIRQSTDNRKWYERSRGSACGGGCGLRTPSSCRDTVKEHTRLACKSSRTRGLASSRRAQLVEPTRGTRMRTPRRSCRGRKN